MILTIPMKLPSVANQRLHWAVKAKQVKAQRDRVLVAILKCPGKQALAQFVYDTQHEGDGRVLLVTLTRVAPRKLDSDNLVSAFKAIRDSVASFLGIDDGNDEAVRWACQQRTGPATVVISFCAEHPPDASLSDVEANSVRALGDSVKRLEAIT